MKRQEFLTVTGAAIATIAAAPQASSDIPPFEFVSSFWQNLHHTLYFQAQVLETAYRVGSAALSPLNRRAFDDLNGIPEGGRSAWRRALRIYHEHYAALSFVFSDAMVHLDNQLSRSASDAPAGLPDPLRQAFDLAAPVYRASLWPKHDSENRAFIIGLRTQLDRFGAAFGPSLARLYQTPWLRMPYRVDIMTYAMSLGSYSNNADDFVHIAMSTADPKLQGLGALDVLFHEASHSIADSDTGSIGDAITSAARDANLPYPDDFWHTVIFYTPGKIAEETFNAAGLGPYTMFAKRSGLFTAAWPRYYEALVKHWQPYMDGKTDLRSAIAYCVNDISSVLM